MAFLGISLMGVNMVMAEEKTIPAGEVNPRSSYEKPKLTELAGIVELTMAGNVSGTDHMGCTGGEAGQSQNPCMGGG